MSWQPQEEPLKELVGYLKDSLSGHDVNAQKRATLMLEQAKLSPDINNYLAYLLASPQLPSSLSLSLVDFHSARSSAGIMLKNDIKTSYKSISNTSQAYVRTSVLLALQDSNAQIRAFAGNVITEIVRQGGVLGWPQLLLELFSLAHNDSGNISPEAQEGATGALVKVCEDNKKVLDKDYQGERPMDFIIPKLLALTASPLPKVRSQALACINAFIPQKPRALIQSLDTIMERLFQLASDSSNDVRRQVCRTFVLIVDIRPDKIAPHMGGLVDFIVTQQRKSEDPDLMLEAAEFWLAVSENEILQPSLGPYLPKVIPVLLQSMIYSEDDIFSLEGGDDDAEQEDRDEDIKPLFASSKGGRALASASNNESASKDATVNGVAAITSVADEELSDGEIDEIDDDDDGDGDPEERWNLRKCSAASLDTLASVFHEPVFEATLPYLLENLRHEEWPNREAAVLALGAVAEGCMIVVTPHLPALIPYLLSLLNDPEPVVRKITCWTLGRYSGWAAYLEDAGMKAQYFVPMMEGILQKMLDSNKKVQEAAATAFANLEENAGERLIPYCKPIVQQFALCFSRYKERNMFTLYDCIQTLAEKVDHALAQDELMEILMSALINRWHKVSDQARELFPLLECLSYVATALGPSFFPFAEPIFDRCIRIIHLNLQEYLTAISNGSFDTPDKDFLVTSLDLLSAIIQALGSKQSEQLVGKTQPSFFELLSFCMEDPSYDVRQSSYALLGDSAIYVFPRLQPHLSGMLPTLIKQLALDNLTENNIDTGYSVINNASWSAGEISIRHGKGMVPWAKGLYQMLLAILRDVDVPESVSENVAIALGRLGIGCAEELGPSLGEFAELFLSSIRKVDETDEKGTAFQGFTMIVNQNPQAMERCLLTYFHAIATYEKVLRPKTHASEVLKPLFQQTLAGYKQIIPDFKAFLEQMSPQDRAALTQTYGV
ncbi:MAG: hypothetical protein M1824_002277 [Vezdaea acicularis]|nr:MAG: hypothetical protein M1824_002277 [Vezdaea acicularis]